MINIFKKQNILNVLSIIEDLKKKLTLLKSPKEKNTD